MKNRKAEPGLRLINMEDVAVEQVEWLLYPFIPYGKVTIIQGDPGEGKTTMVLQIIAKLTKRMFPLSFPHKVLLFYTHTFYIEYAESFELFPRCDQLMDRIAKA